MGILYGKETEQGYEPSWWHRFFLPEVSGNALNGLGESEVRRPTPAYHRQDYWHPWRLIQDMFYIRMTIQGTFVSVVKSHWLDFKKPAPISERRVERSPEDWAGQLNQAVVLEFSLINKYFGESRRPARAPWRRA